MATHMTSLTLSSDTLSGLDNAQDIVEIRNSSGRVLGYFHPVGLSGNAAAASPFSDDVLRERQKQRTGKPLADVLADLPSR